MAKRKSKSGYRIEFDAETYEAVKMAAVILRISIQDFLAGAVKKRLRNLAKRDPRLAATLRPDAQQVAEREQLEKDEAEEEEPGAVWYPRD